MVQHLDNPNRDKSKTEELARKYSSVLAAIERVSLLFEVEFYFVGIGVEWPHPAANLAKFEAIRILVAVESKVKWHSLIRYLIDNEGFYPGDMKKGYFHKRGSIIELRSLNNLDRLGDAGNGIT